MIFVNKPGILFTLFLSIILIKKSTAAGGSKKCLYLNDLPSVKNFEPETYEGKWFYQLYGVIMNKTDTIEDFLVEILKTTSCIEDEFVAKNSSEFILNLKGQIGGQKVEMPIEVEVNKKKSQYTGEVHGLTLTIKVLATDYENWSIEYICGKGDFLDSSISGFVIRTRTRALSPEQTTTVQKVFENFFLDENKIIGLDSVKKRNVYQKNC